MGQLTIAANQPNDTEMYECKKNEAKLIKCLYDQTTNNCLGLRKELAYIVLCGDSMECFFSYGYNEKKSKILYSVAKDKIPNAIVSPDKEVSFQADLLHFPGAELRRPQVELLYQFVRQMAETSNANIIRNPDYLLAMNNKDNSNIVWVGPTKQRFVTTKFKLTY